MTVVRKRYRAFISYSQKDKRHAVRLHKAMEAYRVPAGLVAPGLSKDCRLGRFFRDDDEMGAVTDIGASVRGAIEDSECLIVMCSPRAAQSKWVDAEVRHYRATGRADRIFAVIVDGIPNSGDPKTECFPPAFRLTDATEGALAGLASEPLGLDIRVERFAHLRARLAAGLLSVPFDDLWNRDRRRARTRLIKLLAASAGLFAGLGWFAVAQVRSTSLERSTVLANAARQASDEGYSDLLEEDRGSTFARALRLSVLAARSGFLSPSAVEARSQLARAAHASRLRARLPGEFELGHSDAVRSAEFSPDGTQIVTASNDGTARVWTAGENGAWVTTGRLVGHKGPLRAAVFSPDGMRIVTASEDATARVWAIGANGVWTESGRLEGHESPVNSSVFSPDGTYVVTMSLDYAPRLWAVTMDGTWFEAARLEVPGFDVYSVAFSPDGARIVIPSSDGTARVWEVGADGAWVETNRLEGHENAVASAAFGPDGTQVVTASWDGTSRVWAETQDGIWNELTRFVGHTAGVRWASFSPDGTQVLTVSTDQTVRIWDTATGGQRGQLRGHAEDPDGLSETIHTAEFSPDGTRVVTAAIDNTARIWSEGGFDEWVEIARLEGHIEPVFSAAFSPNGELVVTSSRDGTARVWAAETQWEWRGEAPAEVRSAEFSPDGTRIVAAGSPVQIWTEQSTGIWVVTGRIDVESYDAAKVDFGPTGTRIVHTAGLFESAVPTIWSESPDGVWYESGRLRGHQGAVYTAAFNLEGTQIVTSSSDHTARIWAEDGDGTWVEIGRLEGYGVEVRAAAFSPDGTQVVMGLWDGTALVMTLGTDETWAETARLEGHEYPLTSIAFSPDGKLLVTTSNQGSATVWATGANWTAIGRIGNPGPGGFSAASFSPDGKRVVTAASDAVQIWELAANGIWTETAQIKGHYLDVNSAAFNSDGTRIVTAGRDRTVRVWDISWLAADQIRAAQALSPLIEAVCTEKLNSSISRITDSDARSVPLLRGREGDDVCECRPDPFDRLLAWAFGNN